jgi:hypothetical protein
MNLKQLDSFHKTRTGYLVFGLVELGLSYLFFSLAVNSGSLWEWTLAFVLFVGFAQNLVRLIGTLIHGRHQRKAS